MKWKTLILTVTLATFLSAGCSALPIQTEIKTGETVAEPVDIPLPAGATSPLSLTLTFGAGSLSLIPNPGPALLAGTATYNVQDFQPKVETAPDQVSLKQGNLKINAVPTINERIVNEWSLALSAHPVNLTIKAGAYKGDYEFGGLSITDLHIADGASTVDLTFTTPNQASMNTFRYETGASDIKLSNLSNANFKTMIFQSGAGSYTLDFSGTLQQDASVFVETGLSRVMIIVPKGMPAEVQFEGPLAQVNVKGNWQEEGEVYRQSGQGPKLTFVVETSAGTVTLKNP
jgi:hypothetical protein